MDIKYPLFYEYILSSGYSYQYYQNVLNYPPIRNKLHELKDEWLIEIWDIFKSSYTSVITDINIVETTINKKSFQEKLYRELNNTF